tara:strand:+ start:2059 stop:3030 length:972 start_codon:yes stop_codon:yes gene_type:complete
LIYSFNIKNNFLEDLRDNLEYPDLKYIVNFFEEFILEKENLYYFDNRNLISNSKLSSGINRLLILQLQESLEKKIKPINKLKDTEVDFIFSNEINKNTRQRTISVKEILDNRTKLTIELRKMTPTKWNPSKLKGSKNLNDQNLKGNLKDSLKRIFKYADKIYFVDAFLPSHLMGGKEYFIKGFENSFILFESLCHNIKQVEFYNGLKKGEMEKKNFKKEKLEEKLKKFYKIFKKFKAPVKVKYGGDAYKTIYHRMFISFLDDENIGIFEVDRGLNIIGANPNTTEDRVIEKKDNDWCSDLMEKWAINVDKSPNYIEFNTSEII